MLDRLTALMTSQHGTKIFVASLVFVFGTTAGVVVRAATDGNDGGGSGGSGDNAAVAVNTQDDSSKIRISFKVTRTNADTVDSSNAAVAASSCTSCETVAIAIQAVIAWGDPSIVSPTNLALAINVNCTLCLSYADARQHVITADGPPNFSAEGNQRIAAIRSELPQLKKAWREGTLTQEELKTRVDALSAELADIIADEFMAASAEAPVTSASPTASAAAGSPGPDTAEESGSSDVTSSPETEPSSTSAPQSPEPSEPAPTPSLSD